jgi:hypothetical protein
MRVPHLSALGGLFSVDLVGHQHYAKFMKASIVRADTAPMQSQSLSPQVEDHSVTQLPSTGKPKEELLREEVRFYADMQQKYMQWGVTVLVSLQTAIFFVRRDLAQSYLDSGTINRGQELPILRYLVGTGFLTTCAIIFWKLTNRVNIQYRHYKDQLTQSNRSGIVDKPTTGVADWIRYLYFAFPIYDVAARVWIEVTLHLR